MSIWRDKDFIARSVAAQRAYMMLLAQKDINNAGVQPLMIRKWAKACDHTSEADVVASLDELQVHRFICYDTDTEELLIRSFIRNDGIIKQPNILKNALRVAEQTESPRLRKALADELASLKRQDASETASRIVPDNVSNPYGTLPEPLNPSGTLSKGRGVGDGVGEVTLGSTQVGGVQSRETVQPNTNPDPDDPPPGNCPKHPNGTDRPCTPCKRARVDREAWQLAKTQQEAAERRAIRQAINDCPDCDDIGWILGVEPVKKCSHGRRSA